MAKTAMYALGVIIVLIILYLVFMSNSPSGNFVGAMAKHSHDVRLRYPHPEGKKSGWIFNRGTWV